MPACTDLFVTRRSRSRLTHRWSGRVKDKMPSSYAAVRAAQLNRQADLGTSAK
jgi:hypothetical protein